MAAGARRGIMQACVRDARPPALLRKVSSLAKTAPTKQDIVEAIRSCAAKLGRAPSRSEFRSATGMTERQILNYFTGWSEPRRAKRFPVAPRAAIGGTVVGLLGALLLFSGLGGISSLIRGWRLADVGDVFVIVTFNVLGVLCVTVAVRWIRSTTVPPFD